MLSEQGVYLGLNGGNPLELHVERGFQPKQQFFVPVKTFHNGFHDWRDDGRNQRLERGDDGFRRIPARPSLRRHGASVSRRRRPKSSEPLSFGKFQHPGET